MPFKGVNFSKFSWGACPQIPLDLGNPPCCKSWIPEDNHKKAQKILQLILDGLSLHSAEERPLQHGASATSCGDVGACSSSPATQTAPATQMEGNRHGFVSKVIYGRIKSNCDAIVMHCLPAVCMLSHGIAVVGYATKIRII